MQSRKYGAAQSGHVDYEVRNARQRKRKSEAARQRRGAGANKESYGLGGLFGEEEEKPMRRKRAVSQSEKAVAHRSRAKQAMIAAVAYRKSHPGTSMGEAMKHGWANLKRKAESPKRERPKKRRKALSAKEASNIERQLSPPPAPAAPPARRRITPTQVAAPPQTNAYAQGTAGQQTEARILSQMPTVKRTLKKIKRKEARGQFAPF